MPMPAIDAAEYAALNVTFGGQAMKFTYRPNSLGDRCAVGQVFQEGCYHVTKWPQGTALLKYHAEMIKTRPVLIVDAGANIGAAAVFFANLYANAVVFAIEPELHNWQLLQANVAALPKALAWRGALASHDGTICLDDPKMGDMAFRTSTSPTADTIQTVPCISPAGILAHPITQGCAPLIFKIDIEGAEAELFAGDTQWMRQFPLVVIELHDWMLPFSGSAKNFLKAVADYDWDFLHRGENIFLFNRPMLQPYA